MSLLNILTLSTIQTEEVRAVELLSGYVGSADTGSEDLVRASRAALLGFCDISPRNTELICKSLTTVLKINLANDRILVPALEVIGFLFDTQIFQNSQVEYVPPSWSFSCIIKTLLGKRYSWYQKLQYTDTKNKI